MAETIIRVDPRILKVHPRNAEFFDDVNGAEFDRLVESIKDHGVLTPLRVTKDMTIISGHQRMRAAIEAECFNVPVIVDESDDDNDVLMKLIETNFGRMKNDKVKQAKWLAEYEKLKGVRQGSAGQADPNNLGGVTQDDIAKELGVTTETLRNLKSLLKLDPALQALISDGKINATTGFKILSKLTPEEQAKLVDKLPDDVKFSAKSIETHIEQLREELNGNTNKAREEVDKLIGERERLMRENNELRAGNIPISAEAKEKQDKLEQERRDYYEKYQASEKGKETLREMLKQYNDEIVRLKAAADGGDENVIALQNEVDTLKRQIEAEERKSRDLEFQLEEKEDAIRDLQREKKEAYERDAFGFNDTPEKLTQRERDALVSDIQLAVGGFQATVDGLLTRLEDFYDVDKAVLRTLVETTSQAVSIGTRLKVALMTAAGSSEEDDYDPRDSSYCGGNCYDVDLDNDYEIDDSGLDFSLGA